MKYFIDTHDRGKGSFPKDQLTELNLLPSTGALEGRAFCFTAGPHVEVIRKAHDAISLPYDSITDVRRVTGVDLREAPDVVKGAQAVS